ncbi:MAG: single-stranded-DNA-specific exonuclease RecJ [Candidatus Hydrogenedentota bacterium]
MTPHRFPAYHWHTGGPDRQKALSLARDFGMPPLVAQLLVKRGVETAGEAEHYLNPSAARLRDPFNLTDMDKAVARLRRARETQERVRVFGDFDVDGITSTALLVLALRRYGFDYVDYALPHRLVEGFGLDVEHVRQAKADGVDLLVTVDNGIAALDAADAAREQGVDLIVTDHHQLAERLPAACAVVNPQREAPDHPSRDAAGAAVAFKLAWALTGEQADLDLVALGVVADVVPLRGENRDLAAAGLNEINANPRLGIQKLAETAGLRKGRRTSEQIGFQLAPRINAGGRLGSGMEGLELLLTECPKEAARLAKELDTANDERRGIEQAIFEDALAELNTTFKPDQRSIVLARREWHPGVVGIVASRLQRQYYRPVVLVAIGEDGAGRGSARSVKDFDIAEALRGCQSHLERHGGHEQAAGMTILEDQLEAFRESFESAAAQGLPEGDLSPTLTVDALASLSEIDLRLVRNIERLEPFGHGNPAPVFAVNGVSPVRNSMRELRNNHMRMAVRGDDRIVNCIGFGMAGVLSQLQPETPIDIAFTPKFDTWRDEPMVQLQLKDVRP